MNLSSAAFLNMYGWASGFSHLENGVRRMTIMVPPVVM